jgi:thioredoxin 1
MGAAKTLSLAEFEAVVKRGKGVSVIDFGATWCGPCQALAPAYEKLATEYAGKAALYKVDVDAEGDLAAAFDVMSVPTVVFLKDGSKVAEIKGNYPDRIKTQLDGILN